MAKSKGLSAFLNNQKEDKSIDEQKIVPKVPNKEGVTSKKDLEIEKEVIHSKDENVNEETITIVEKNKAKRSEIISFDNDKSLSFNSLVKEMDEYKQDFNLSGHYNVRLSEDNYQKLKKLKATDTKMVHLVNLAISKIVNSKEYIKYIKG